MHPPYPSPFAWLAMAFLVLGTGLFAQDQGGRIAVAAKGTAVFAHPLVLAEPGRYLELPRDVFNDFTEATVEAWVKWNAFGNRYQRIFNYGRGGRDIGLTSETGTNTLWFVIAT